MSPKSTSVFDVPFWENQWKELGRSFLSSHQKRHPDRWRRFYDVHGPDMREISGLDNGQAVQIVDSFFDQGLLTPDTSVVDIGCGNGWLALPMARKNIHVLAVDTSEKMLSELHARAGELNGRFLKTRQSCWTGITPERPFGMALAACFPPVLSPGGIQKMERLGKKCALMLPGSEPGPIWIKKLWQELFGRSPFTGGRHLQTALNYLMAAGRSPGLIPLAVPFSVNLSWKQVLEYYTGYFSLFDKPPGESRPVIEQVLSPYIHDGRVVASGKIHYGLVWWRTPHAAA